MSDNLSTAPNADWSRSRLAKCHRDSKELIKRSISLLGTWEWANGLDPERSFVISYGNRIQL